MLAQTASDPLPVSALNRILEYRDTESVDEHALVLAQFRDRLDAGEVTVDVVSSLPTVKALASVVLHLIDLRRTGYYDDDCQCTLYDAALILSSILSQSMLDNKCAPEQRLARRYATTKQARALQTTALDTLFATNGNVFHADARKASCNLLLLLERAGARMPDNHACDFARRVDEILLSSGQYSLQNNIVWLLYELAMVNAACKSTLHKLQQRFGALEDDDIACTPGAPDPPPSPRKMLDSFNRFHGARSGVISLIPLAIVRAAVHAPRHARMRSQRAPPRKVSCASLTLTPRVRAPARTRTHRPPLATRCTSSTARG